MRARAVLPLNPDLHSHSTFSDGVLAPEQLVLRAKTNGVSMLALTDHDNVDGLARAAAAAATHALHFVPGVEVSAMWSETTVHVVGLGIDAQNRTLTDGLAHVRAGRARRAQRIAADLERVGIEGSLAGALAYAGHPESIGRMHFARFLAARGCASDAKAVFRHYLVPGKPGYVPHAWCAMADAVQWIRAAGGAAVLAHPGRYDLTRVQMTRLLEAFKAAGGAGIEVVTGGHSPEQCTEYARYAQAFDLLASRGSDFHGAAEQRVDLGRLQALPHGLRPIWSVLV